MDLNLLEAIEKDDPDLVTKWVSSHDITHRSAYDLILQTAAKYKATKIIGFIIKTRPKICLEFIADTDNHGNFLHWAAAEGILSVVRAMVEIGVNPNSKNLMGQTALHCAAINKHVHVARFLLAHDAYIDMLTKEGYTPLHYATVRGDLSTIRLLVAQGANVNMRTLNNETPLDLAMSNNRSLVVRFLMQSGAILEEKHENKKTLKIKKTLKGKQHVVLEGEVRFFLEQFKKAAQAKDHDEIMSLIKKVPAEHFLEVSSELFFLHWAAKENWSDPINLALERGADLSLRDKEGKTALHYAAEKGHVQAMQCFLNYGDDINGTDNESHRPIDYAANNNRVAAVSFLLEQGANPPRPRTAQHYALHRAAREGNEKEIVFLLMQGTNRIARDQEGKTPLDHAVEALCLPAIVLLYRSDDCIDGSGHTKDLYSVMEPDENDTEEEELKKAEALSYFEYHNRNTLCSNIRSKHIPYVRVWLENASDEFFGIVSTTENTVAIRKDIINLFIATILEQEFVVNELYAPTIFHWAAAQGYVAIIQRGINYHLNLEAHERTPFDVALSSEQTEVVSLMLKHKVVDPNMRTPSGTTYLHEAVFSENISLVQLLVNYGAKQVPDKEGKTPLDYANEASVGAPNREKIINVLEIYGSMFAFDKIIQSSAVFTPSFENIQNTSKVGRATKLSYYPPESGALERLTSF